MSSNKKQITTDKSLKELLSLIKENSASISFFRIDVGVSDWEIDYDAIEFAPPEINVFFYNASCNSDGFIESDESDELDEPNEINEINEINEPNEIDEINEINEPNELDEPYELDESDDSDESDDDSRPQYVFPYSDTTISDILLAIADNSSVFF